MKVNAILANSHDGGGGVRPGPTSLAGCPNHPTSLRRGITAILTSQAVLGGLAGAAAWGLTGTHAAVAAGLGAAIAMVDLLHLGRRLTTSAAAARRTPLYLGAAERFLFTGLAFAIAITRLHLPALPLLAGFACAQLGHLAGAAAPQDMEPRHGR